MAVAAEDARGPTAPMATTVAVPARNAAKTIQQCLLAIYAQRPAPARVLVLDDHSTDGTARLAADGGAEVVPVPDPGGLGVARNLAMTECGTRYLAFLNADCYAAPTWLSTLAEAMRESGVAVAGGAQRELRHGTVAERWKALHLRQDLGDRRIAEPDHLSGGNLLLDLRRLGQIRFDERYASAYEDVDFCRRLRAAGGRLLYEPSAVVHHDHPETLVTLPRKVWSYGAWSHAVGPVRGVRGAWRGFVRMHRRPHDQARTALRDDLRHLRLSFLGVDLMLFAASLLLYHAQARRQRGEGVRHDQPAQGHGLPGDHDVQQQVP